MHVVDAQSPMRVEWTDRLDDDSAVPATGLFASAYRPQEMLSGQIADAMVRRLNQITAGPVTGKPLALAIQTGDNSDNSQLNEVRWNIDVLDGGQVRVDSGDPTRWEGVHDGDPTYYDPHYWHPHGTPPGSVNTGGRPAAQPAGLPGGARGCSTRPVGRSRPRGCRSRGTPPSATTTASRRATSPRRPSSSTWWRPGRSS